MKIKSILVTAVAPFDDHAANRGEKLLGNASSIKRRPDGRVYVSGQMQRHALFSAVDRLNRNSEGAGDTFVANGDAPTTDIGRDLRSDLGGFLDTNKGNYSGRRTAPVSATPAVALRPSRVGRDLLVRLKMDNRKGTGGDAEGRDQVIATNEYSQNDEMVMNFSLDVGAVGMIKKYQYGKYEGDGDKATEFAHVNTVFDPEIDEVEHARRCRLFLEATASITDYANQARNAVSGEPSRVLIVLDPKHSRKAVRYWKEIDPAPNETEEQARERAERKATERRSILAELDDRGALYFIGDDTGQHSDTPVYEAYKQAIDAFERNELYRPV